VRDPAAQPGEACAAAIHLAENPDATVDELLERMPGPDFPTGGIVVNPRRCGRLRHGPGHLPPAGPVPPRAAAGNLQAIVVTELPYGTSPDQIVAETVKAARAERIVDVTEMPKNLSDRHGLRVQIRCKRGGQRHEADRGPHAAHVLARDGGHQHDGARRRRAATGHAPAGARPLRAVPARGRDEAAPARAELLLATCTG
jgi:hypothetical protein